MTRVLVQRITYSITRTKARPWLPECTDLVYQIVREHKCAERTAKSKHSYRTRQQAERRIPEAIRADLAAATRLGLVCETSARESLIYLEIDHDAM